MSQTLFLWPAKRSPVGQWAILLHLQLLASSSAVSESFSRLQGRAQTPPTPQPSREDGCSLHPPSEGTQQNWALPIAHRNCCYFSPYSASPPPCYWLFKEKPLTSKLAFQILLFGRTSNKISNSQIFPKFLSLSLPLPHSLLLSENRGKGGSVRPWWKPSVEHFQCHTLIWHVQAFFRFLTRFLQSLAFIKQFNNNKIVLGRDTMFLGSLGSSWTRDSLVFSEIVLVQDYKHARDSRILLVCFALWQVFTLQPSLAWKSQSYCLSLENAAIAGMRCHP